MNSLVRLVNSHEDWLMQRILDYALEHGYTKYTSTLKEAWRLSISGLSSSIVEAAKKHDSPPELSAEDDILNNPIAQFGINEAILHRKRGISLQMFLSLFKYYRQTYLDLIDTKCVPDTEKSDVSFFINRVFDIIETGLCVEWAGGGTEKSIHEMQIRNREMTNEKNKYLTIFESLPNPCFLVSTNGVVANVNLAAAKFLNEKRGSGELYYNRASTTASHGKNTLPDFKHKITDMLPWLKVELDQFYQATLPENVFEKEVELNKVRCVFRIKIGKMLDVSKKFDGVILILEDITSLKEALTEVKKLSGLVPICSHCKKMRDDKGYWNRLEEYIESRSDALFSHSVCHECFEKYYDL